MSAAVSALGGDLIVCSEPGPGDGHGAFAPALAEALGMPHLTAIVAAARGDRPGTVIAEQRGDGRVHRFRCALPVALAVAADLGRGPDAPDPAPVDASRVEHVELTGVAAAAPARLALAADTAPRDPAVIATSAEELVAQLAADRILR
jgi:electron transfer flavoprotein alpha/beta subunit